MSDTSVPFARELIHVLQCSLCERCDQQRHRVMAYNKVPIPRIPLGWRLLGAELICPAHKITVEP